MVQTKGVQGPPCRDLAFPLGLFCLPRMRQTKEAGKVLVLCMSMAVVMLMLVFFVVMAVSMTM